LLQLRRCGGRGCGHRHGDRRCDRVGQYGAATSNAYAAGVATGSAGTAAAYSSGTPQAHNRSCGCCAGAGHDDGNDNHDDLRDGRSYAAVPAGSFPVNKNGTTYYLNGNTWFQPAFGANGVYYRVVAAP
jgi:hypothetical protein